MAATQAMRPINTCVLIGSKISGLATTRAANKANKRDQKYQCEIAVQILATYSNH
tara:strand:+ start:1127 stop:1291 length:165 start_codon:yes stop_codon:yes gene_type:complete